MLLAQLMMKQTTTGRGTVCVPAHPTRLQLLLLVRVASLTNAQLSRGKCAHQIDRATIFIVICTLHVLQLSVRSNLISLLLLESERSTNSCLLPMTHKMRSESETTVSCSLARVAVSIDPFSTSHNLSLLAYSSWRHHLFS